jgi:sulfide:quinone oxidoreductase
MTRIRPKLVVLGGGFAGLRMLFHLHRVMDVTLVDPRPTSLAKPALPEVALAGKPAGHARFPLAPVVARHGARYVGEAATRIDPAGRRVVLASGDTIGYDYLAVTVGATKDYEAIAGLERHGYSVCDDTHASALWQALEGFSGGPIVTGAARSTWGTRVRAPALAAPCEGPIGEVAFMASYELRRRRVGHSVTVFSPGQVFFDDVGETVHQAVTPLLEAVGITVMTAKVITEVGDGHVRFEDGTEVASALSIVIPPYRGPAVLADSGLGDEAGFLAVDETMRALDDPRILGAGDATALAMPKLGHIAVHQAEIAAASLRAEVSGEGEVPDYQPEVFCIMNRGGTDATLILSDVIFGGRRDLARSGPLFHLLKWSFDAWSFHTRGHLPPALMGQALEAMLGI